MKVIGPAPRSPRRERVLSVRSMSQWWRCHVRPAMPLPIRKSLLFRWYLPRAPLSGAGHGQDGPGRVPNRADGWNRFVPEQRSVHHPIAAKTRRVGPQAVLLRWLHRPVHRSPDRCQYRSVRSSSHRHPSLGSPQYASGATLYLSMDFVDCQRITVWFFQKTDCRVGRETI